MRNVRRLGLDELILRPGTYFNPQTEIMVVVDDSPDVDNEIFEASEADTEAEWVLVSDETPIDEHQRDDLIERFQHSQQAGAGLGDDEDLDDDDENEELDPDEEEDEDLEELDPMGFGGE